MDALFKALNDPARRALLDALRHKDGQTLTQLERQFDMSRFGVMKHLKVLEEAHLVLVRREGRFKYHYVNVLPLQEMVDRWIDPLLQGPAAALSALKSELETPMTQPAFVMQTFIRCSRDALWDALIDPTQMEKYHFYSIRITEAGDLLSHYSPDGEVMLEERKTKLTPKSRIEQSFEPHWPGAPAPSRSVFLIEEEGDHCKLTVEHYDMTPEACAEHGIQDGWSRWASGLKTWVETGQEAKFAAPAEMA